MSQSRLFDFNETVTSSTLSALLRDLLMPGIYRGFDASVLTGGALSISPGAALLPNGVYVAEDRDQQFLIQPAPSDTAKINYLLICRHRIKNIVGGQPAEFVVTRADALDAALDSSDDPTAPWSYVVIAYINSVGTTGIRDAVVSTPRKIRNVLQSVIETIVVGQNSHERMFATPFGEGAVVVTDAGRFPLPSVAGSGAAVSVASVSFDEVGSLVTLVAEDPHGFQSGQFVSVVNVTDTTYNGTYGPIAVVNPTTITFKKVVVGSLGPSTGGLVSAVFSELASIEGREIRYYPALFGKLEFEAFVPKGLVPDEVFVVARSGASSGSLIDSVPSVLIKVLDSTGQPVVIQEGGTTERLMLISSLDFVNHRTTLNASVSAFPTYGHFLVKLTINNVDLAGVIVSYRGVDASVIKTSDLSNSGIITDLVISP